MLIINKWLLVNYSKMTHHFMNVIQSAFTINIYMALTCNLLSSFIFNIYFIFSIWNYFALVDYSSEQSLRISRYICYIGIRASPS